MPSLALTAATIASTTSKINRPKIRKRPKIMAMGMATGFQESITPWRKAGQKKAIDPAEKNINIPGEDPV